MWLLRFGLADLKYGCCRAENSNEEEEVDTDLTVGDILGSLQANHTTHESFAPHLTLHRICHAIHKTPGSPTFFFLCEAMRKNCTAVTTEEECRLPVAGGVAGSRKQSLRELGRDLDSTPQPQPQQGFSYWSLAPTTELASPGGLA